MDFGPLLPAPGPVDAHSAAWNVIFTYAGLNELRFGHGIDWRAAQPLLIRSLVSDEIANAVGIFEAGGTGAYSIMSSMIAYSAIEVGTMPFGNTAIRALFNDAAGLGLARGLAEGNAYFDRAAQSIMDVAVAYAGGLANSHVIHGVESTTAVQGV